MSAIEEVAVYDLPFEGIEDQIYGWVREALELRHGAAGDPQGPISVVRPGEGHMASTDMLYRVRQRSDRVDELLSKVTQAKGRVTRAKEAAEFEASIAFDMATRNNAARRTIEFSTREERNADAALDSLEQKRLAHHAKRLVSVAQEAYEVVNQVHWQLDGIRKDLRATLHSLQFESSLER